MTATFRYAQIPKVWGELRLVDLPPVEGTFHTSCWPLRFDVK